MKSLGDRMKSYEQVTEGTVLRRTPVIIRVDGKAFHSLTKHINSDIDSSTLTGFSDLFHYIMTATAKQMCTNIQNARFAYTQSDEISILLNDWKNLETEQWFGGRIQKMGSVAASIASVYFNKAWNFTFGKEITLSELPVFDGRVFNVPYDDVDNYFLWRQRDAITNSINFISRKHFSHAQLHGVNADQAILMLNNIGIDWNLLPLWQQRGSCIIPEPGQFLVDDQIPLFNENRAYVTKHLLDEDTTNLYFNTFLQCNKHE